MNISNWCEECKRFFPEKSEVLIVVTGCGVCSKKWEICSECYNKGDSKIQKVGWVCTDDRKE